jgi:DNA-binding transcriptional ArsR family regulator
MSNFHNENNQGIQSDNSAETRASVDNILSSLQNKVDFQIIMFFIMYRERTLSDLVGLIPSVSRATIHRHLQTLLEAGILVLAREERRSGAIKTKIYQLSPAAFNKMPQYSQDQINSMTGKEKLEFYIQMRDALYPTIQFMQSALEDMVTFLQGLNASVGGDLQSFFDEMDFYLNMNFFSEQQRDIFIKYFTEAMQKAMPELIEAEGKNPAADRPYIFLMGLLPLKDMLEKENDRK